jgi:hypothetical protein
MQRDTFDILQINHVHIHILEVLDEFQTPSTFKHKITAIQFQSSKKALYDVN